MSISPATPSGSLVEAIGFGAFAVRTYGRAVGQLGVAEVEIGRVELVRFDRQRLERLEGGDPLGAEPVGLGSFAGEGVDEGPVGEGEWEIGWCPANRARSGDGRR